MKKVLFLTFLILPVLAGAKVDHKLVKRSTASSADTATGVAQVSIAEKGGWIRIEGDPAKSLYEALGDKAKNNEAGPDTYFKKGKSYWCYFSSSDSSYACVISITNSRQGLL